MRPSEIFTVLSLLKLFWSSSGTEKATQMHQYLKV